GEPAAVGHARRLGASGFERRPGGQSLLVQPVIRVHHFTDPGCPFAFSAEPALRKLAWAYGDELEWQTRMIVLSRSPEEYLDRGFTPAVQGEAPGRLAREHAIAIDAP